MVEERKKTELFHWILRVPKDQAAFLYFQLEANEGLCFYSTLDKSLKEPFRDIEIFSPEELEPEMRHFIASIQQEVSPIILLEEKIPDSKEAMNQFSKGGKKRLLGN